jgi:pimeloyl-ACP methyl ester carboxylesterase
MLRFLTFLVSAAISVMPSFAHGQSAERFVELSVPAHDGKVQWSQVAQSIGTALKLDAETLEQILPSGELDLSAGGTLLSLMAINFATNNSIQFSLAYDPAGNPCLSVKCNRDWFGKPNDHVNPTAASLDVDKDWKTKTADRPLVVLIHGLQSEPAALDDFRAYLREKGFATAAAGYDYNQSIASSAEMIHALIESELASSKSSLSISLVGHSMGGLVAREIVEGLEKCDPRIAQLITLASPHHGSSWATLPPMLNLFKRDRLSETDLVDVLLHQPSSPGFCDLMPGSPFMKAMKARSRRTDIRYTSIIGTASPLDSEELRALRSTLQQLDRDGSFVRLIRPRIQPLLSDFNEIDSGTGDGMVSVASATLPGIEDNVSVKRSHFEMVRKQAEGNPNEVWDLVLNRLTNEHAP